ncbi:MAG: hypothetical protein JNM14_12385 [Ferruginibacter sp.]|nr:hypothetical protein [Ferruginibacter sp.]
METTHVNAPFKPLVQQSKHNTTSWIGHRHGETNELISGQTFTCPAAGSLDCIEIFSVYVNKKMPVDLTLYPFDTDNKIWGTALATATVEFSAADTGKWIAFPLKGLKLDKGRVYGFKLHTDEGLLGIGEAAGCADQLPYAGGMEWAADNKNQAGKYFSYLSLAFKIDVRA